MQKNLVLIDRQERFSRTLLDEFSYALERTSQQDLKEWGKQSAQLFKRSAARRGKNFLKGVKKAGIFVVKESFSLINATRTHTMEDYAKTRANAIKSTIHQGFAFTKQNITLMAMAVKNDPKNNAPLLLSSLLGFMFGSGGLDGDGGVPDIDFAFGPGHHRSIWTHSVFSAMVIETAVFSIVELVKVIHTKLPEPHHPFWDKLMDKQKQFAQAFANGASLGIAYHLMVDMNLLSAHTKPYVDLPFSTTMQGHQTIMGANAATELADLKERKKSKK